MDNMKKYVAEMIGTFALVFIGCGSAVIAGDKIGFLGISFAFGLTVLAMVYAIGGISGCHINPAITVSMLVADKIKKKDAIYYVASQFIGAILASIVLLAVLSGRPNYSLETKGLGQNGWGKGYIAGYSMTSAFIAEVVLTGLFLIVIFGATSSNAPAGFAGMAIGLSLVVIHLIGIPITGTSVNPARSLGPALVVGGKALSQVWLFLVAPTLGGIVAALCWKHILSDK
ncbi:MAG: aquaporin Z [Candidatus Altiarchaeota archaeon]